jgi:hypothetical protein
MPCVRARACLRCECVFVCARVRARMIEHV